ncbi:polymorphic outer membrane protein, partial [Chlamydia psittaci 84-8471/1]
MENSSTYVQRLKRRFLFMIL